MGHRGLKAKRMLMGVTQQEISKEIGIACKTYNLKENGVNDFKLSEVSKISKYLDLSAQEIKDIFIFLPKCKFYLVFCNILPLLCYNIFIKIFLDIRKLCHKKFG